MSDDERELRPLELAVDDVQVGAADGAGADAEQDLSRARFRTRDLFELQRLPCPMQHHRPHAS
jgi:hypothetical protein